MFAAEAAGGKAGQESVQTPVGRGSAELVAAELVAVELVGAEQGAAEQGAAVASVPQV